MYWFGISTRLAHLQCSFQGGCMIVQLTAAMFCRHCATAASTQPGCYFRPEHRKASSSCAQRFQHSAPTYTQPMAPGRCTAAHHAISATWCDHMVDYETCQSLLTKGVKDLVRARFKLARGLNTPS